MHTLCILPFSSCKRIVTATPQAWESHNYEKITDLCFSKNKSTTVGTIIFTAFTDLTNSSADYSVIITNRNCSRVMQRCIRCSVQRFEWTNKQNKAATLRRLTPSLHFLLIHLIITVCFGKLVNISADTNFCFEMFLPIPIYWSGSIKYTLIYRQSWTLFA